MGCSRCLIALHSEEGEFGRYKGQDVTLTGLTSCWDCPGNLLIPRLTLMKLANEPLHEDPTTIHFAPCVLHCQHGEAMIDKVEDRSDVEVVRGAHPYRMERIFGRTSSHCRPDD